MRALLSIEWLKIRRYRTFWIQAGLFLLLFPLWNLGVKSSILSFGDGGTGILTSSYSFPAVWGNVGFWGSVFVLFLAILTIILTCNEFTFRTHRQNVIDGWSRLNFFHGKVALVVAGSLLATLFMVIIGVFLGSTTGGFDGFEGGWEKVLYFFVLCLNYLGFALLLALFMRRSGMAIGLFFLYSLVLEKMLSSFINWKANTQVGNLLPLQSSDELLPLPLLKKFGGLIGLGSSTPDTTYLLVSLAWIAIYYFVGRRLMLRRDL